MNLVIDKKTVDEIILEVAPRIGELTGWDVDLENITFELINRDEYWEKCIRPFYAVHNLEQFLNGEVGQKELRKMQDVEVYATFAMYEPYNDKIFLIPENFSAATNRKGLCSVLGHEIVHRCQKNNNPEFEKTLDNLAKLSHAHFLMLDKTDSYIDMLVNTMMTLIEGDACFTQTQLENKFYSLPKLLFSSSSRACCSDNQKQIEKEDSYYFEGEKFVEMVFKDGGRTKVNALYNLDPDSLHITMRSMLDCSP